MVGDGDAMGIASQIMQHMFGSAEGRLGIDDPVLAIERAQEDGEALLACQCHALSRRSGACSRAKEAPQPGHELAAEDAAEHLRPAGRMLERDAIQRDGPAPVRRRAPRSGRADVAEGLSPGVQDAQGSRSLRRGAWDRRRPRAGLRRWPRTEQIGTARLLFCHISGTSSCGTLKTRWK